MMPPRTRRRRRSPFVLDPVARIKEQVADDLTGTIRSHRRGTITGQVPGSNGRFVTIANTGESGVADTMPYPVTVAYSHTHIVGTPSTVTIGAAAGTGGSVTSWNGLDTRGQVVIHTGGAGTAAGTLCTVTFSQAFPDQPYGTVSWNTTLTSIAPISSTFTTTGFTVYVSAALSLNTTYTLTWICISAPLAPQLNDDTHITDLGPKNPIIRGASVTS